MSEKAKSKAIPVKFTVYLQFAPNREELRGIRRELNEITSKHLINLPPFKIGIGVSCKKCGYITDVNPDSGKGPKFCRNCNGMIVYDL